MCREICFISLKLCFINFLKLLNLSITVPLAYDDYSVGANPRLSPLVISHGMLGSRYEDLPIGPS